MLIWLKHPSHGIKDCYCEAEAIADEKMGWTRFDRDAEVAAAKVAADEGEQRRGPGRPPKSL